MKTKTLRQKYLEQLKKNRENDLVKTDYRYDRYVTQAAKALNDFYLPRTSGYLGNSGCYHTSRKAGAR
jgi:hypothetical protein